jgi:hypothetical protein
MALWEPRVTESESDAGIVKSTPIAELTVNIKIPEVPPPGPGLVTVTFNVPAVATLAEAT